MLPVTLYETAFVPINWVNRLGERIGRRPTLRKITTKEAGMSVAGSYYPSRRMKVAPAALVASPTGTLTPSSELIMRQAAHQSVKQVQLKQAGRIKLEQVRARQSGAN